MSEGAAGAAAAAGRGEVRRGRCIPARSAALPTPAPDMTSIHSLRTCWSLALTV
jgi:hypothetical protein